MEIIKVANDLLDVKKVGEIRAWYEEECTNIMQKKTQCSINFNNEPGLEH